MHHSSQGMYKKNILSKSLNMEVFRSSIGVLLIFFLLVVGSRIVGYFEQAAEGNIDPGIILSVITLRFPDFITLLIPLSFFLGLLITIGRLNSEGEIHGYFSAGLSKFNLIKFLLPQAFIYFFITLVLSLYIAPYTKNLSKDLLVIDSFEEQIDAIQSDEIVSLDDGGFLYVQTADEGLIKGVKLFQVDEDNSFIVISDELLTTEKDKTIELNLKNGSFYGGLFSESSKIISNFNNFNFEIDKNMSQSNDLSLTKLFDYSSASDQATFQWNISIPITILILLLYGIYISSSKPREGKFSFMLPGMLIYVSYLSLLILGREFISDNPGSIFNLWFIHGLFILFLFLYAYREKIIFVSFANLAIQENIYLRYFIGIMIFILFIWMVA
ncbi:MAG: LptF/LptG family permease [Proteobacteria bacterium]|nr:LptF/LptG family permease [Pseudomonadota bacterium]NCV99246.1 LptF/LptG family permease [Pseudomonadota bacterium]NCX41796.1 LptF/LptG family permease [Pseudomonadota bacterium]NCX74506.1 LptF/LptG family permease [Pseudomonadota bacterium]NDH59611.1 LptF/LptG family permease [Pseudomonadota bacterium]